MTIRYLLIKDKSLGMHEKLASKTSTSSYSITKKSAYLDNSLMTERSSSTSKGFGMIFIFAGL
jgi:hypothetical protein